MAHALPASPGRRRRNRLIIAALVAAVVVVLAVGGLVIRNHHHHASASAQTTGTSSPASTTTPAPTTAVATTTVPPTTVPPTTVPPTTVAPTTSPTTTPATTASPTTAPVVAKVDLVIANNTGRNGLASTARSRFEAGGWTVTAVGNISGGILSTCAFYDPNNPDNLAAAEALQKQFPAIKRVEPRFSRLPVAPIVVVLTSDYS